MKRHISICTAMICCFLLAKPTPVFCQVRLPRLIRDSMILQREAPIKIWGWAAAGEKVRISFNNKNYNTTTGADGTWQLSFLPMKAGGPYTMHINASNQLTIKDILIGDVWLCSGQSNMVHQMSLHAERYAQEIAQANDPQIRQFWIPTATDLQKPKDDLPAGYWKSANPTDVLQFSAVAYFFAKTLYKKYGVPIGLINASVGGTPIEAWTSEEGLKTFPDIYAAIQKNKDTSYINAVNQRAFAINAANQIKPQDDKGFNGTTPWYDTAYLPKGWRTINIPGYWEDQGVSNLDGVVWYRKEINIPAAMAGLPAKIAMGRIVDADFVYINGKLIGNTSYQYPQRRYRIPAGILHSGINTIVIRVINTNSKGGFVPDKPYYLAAGNDTIDLKGTWQYKVGTILPPGRITAAGISIQNQPAALFNAMIAPLTNYTIKGVIWYQGESNISNATEYEKLLPTLIADWRNQFHQNTLPFIYVQLPNFGDVHYWPRESAWAVLREAQLKTLSVPNTGMAVAIDLGEWNDIHPDRKKEVGERLALAAEKVAYDEKNIVYSGPVYQSSKVEGNKIIITFTHTGSGLIANDNEPLSGFAIAGADKKFVPAQAQIKGNKVVVWSDAILQPMYVRYAWADNPDGTNLYNKEGLPASPFRTDN